MIRNKRISISILAGILFLIIMILVIFGKTKEFDTVIYQGIMTYRNPLFDSYFITVTKLGNTSIVILVVLLFIVAVRGRHALFLTISSIDSALLTTIFKYLIQRSRPSGLKLISQGGYSFPSGHAMISVCVYGYLLYFAITRIKNKFFKYVVSILLLLVILSIGVSRIYVGVHFASDVLAGHSLGLCYLFLLINVEEKFYMKRG